MARGGGGIVGACRRNAASSTRPPGINRRAKSRSAIALLASTEVSKIDYFHPNVAGQADLAAVTWAASYWGT